MLTKFHWRSYRYFPYEKRLARREIEALLKVAPEDTEGGLLASVPAAEVSSLDRLTYFAQIQRRREKPIVPLQTRLELAARMTPQCRTSNNVSRQSTRYSAHGLHEYRGKFNPQIVRSTLNILQVRRDAWVLDPFTGSGTTLVELAHLGINGVGIDLNPLAVLISRAKLEALSTEEKELSAATERLIAELTPVARSLSYDDAWSDAAIASFAGLSWEAELPNLNYLGHWFPRSVLAQISLALRSIDATTSSLASVFRVVLSDLLRRVSLQEPADLRIRRRKKAEANYPLVPMFIQSVRARLSSIIRARSVLGSVKGVQRAILADSRESLKWMKADFSQVAARGFSAAITSPPYVTALPYIDTQRLSLCVLGLAQADDIRILERQLMGTREIGDTRRRELETALREDTMLAPSVRKLCSEMLDCAGDSSNGFRRRNVPALTYQYFVDMARVFKNVAEVMPSGAPFALVVGRNRTVLGKREFVIDTPSLLGETASVQGWSQREVIELDTYNRFDLHQKNSIRSESLVVLQRL